MRTHAGYKMGDEMEDRVGDRIGEKMGDKMGDNMGRGMYVQQNPVADKSGTHPMATHYHHIGPERRKNNEQRKDKKRRQREGKKGNPAIPKRRFCHTIHAGLAPATGCP